MNLKTFITLFLLLSLVSCSSNRNLPPNEPDTGTFDTDYCEPPGRYR
jgi:hypothetical protein